MIQTIPTHHHPPPPKITLPITTTQNKPTTTNHLPKYTHHYPPPPITTQNIPTTTQIYPPSPSAKKRKTNLHQNLCSYQNQKKNDCRRQSSKQPLSESKYFAIYQGTARVCLSTTTHHDPNYTYHHPNIPTITNTTQIKAPKYAKTRPKINLYYLSSCMTI